MPHPREAIFDVLRSKAERIKQERRIMRGGKTQAEALDEWNKQNQAARSASTRKR